MSILVSCACGKRYKTGDQFAGKTSHCPACGRSIIIPAASVPPAISTAIASTSTTKINDPLAAALKPAAIKSTTPKASPAGRFSSSHTRAVPGFFISRKFVVLIVLAILIPSVIYWVRRGPLKAAREWSAISAKAGDNINGQITRAIQHHYKVEGFDTTDLATPHKATSMFFDEQVMLLRLPDSVPFQGSSTDGHFHGQFHPRTWRFDADVTIESAHHQVTGSASETDQSLAVDGVPIKD